MPRVTREQDTNTIQLRFSSPINIKPMRPGMRIQRCRESDTVWGWGGPNESTDGSACSEGSGDGTAVGSALSIVIVLLVSSQYSTCTVQLSSNTSECSQKRVIFIAHTYVCKHDIPFMETQLLAYKCTYTYNCTACQRYRKYILSFLSLWIVIARSTSASDLVLPLETLALSLLLSWACISVLAWAASRWA